MKKRNTITKRMRSSPPRKRERESLDVHLSLRMKVGNAPDDTIAIFEDRHISMAGSIFEYRGRILKTLTLLLMKLGLTGAKAARRRLPLLKFSPGRRTR